LFCSQLQFAGFGQHGSSDAFSARCRFGQVRQARSSVTCVAVLGFGNTGRLTVGTFAPDAVASVTASGQFVWRAQASGLRSFVPLAMTSPSPASFAPNSSFKPTPHRGVNSVLYATLHAVATPPWGGLTPALGP